MEARWSTVDSSFFPTPDWSSYEKNECRVLVEVEGGIDWKIRRLTESCPEFCWKFIDAKIIAYYYFDKADKIIRDNADHEQMTGIPLFYATLPYFTSPYEISIQPRFLDKIREKLHHNLLEYYSQNTDRFLDDQLFETVPCAIAEKGKWFRGKITSISKSKTNALVLLVDFGVERFVSLSDIHPLSIRFAKIPPLALKCRVKNVFINEMDAGKVNKFKRLIDDLKNTVRVEICSNDEPFFVNLFHPTIANENIGSYFYKPADHLVIEAERHRHWLEHKRKQQEIESESSEEDKDEEEDEEADIFIKSFGRSAKFPRGDTQNLLVVHVENSTLIYLRSDWMQNELKAIEKELENEWDSFPPFPVEQLTSGTACVCSFKGKKYRAIFERNVDEMTEVFLLDYGKYVLVSRSHLRVLFYTEPFTKEPMLYAVSLERSFNYFPHPSESLLLKEMMPTGSAINFCAIKSRNRIPVLGQITDSNGDIDFRLEEKLLSQRVNVFSREVVLYKTRIAGSVDCSFTHRFTCPTTLVKGNLSYCVLSEF